MNAALYIRVSTEDQIELSPDSQKKLLLEYAQKNNLVVDDCHIFIDEGISGRKADKRPAFMNMIALAKSKNKPFAKILVWKFSRFARNQEESIVYKNMLRKDGVDVISISEPIIEGPFGSLIERIIEWMDEYYSIRLSSEVTRGMKEKAIRGGVQASPALGYNIINNKYVINPEEAPLVKTAFEKYLEGKTFKEISNYFNLIGAHSKRGNKFQARNIKYILENPVYCGMVRWNYATQKGTGRKVNPEDEHIIAKGCHEPIISEELFKSTQEKIKLNSKHYTRKPSTEYKHWLGGLLRCSSCGGTLTYFGYSKSSLTPNSKYKGYFQCNKHNKGSCDTKNNISVRNAELAVKKLLVDVNELLKKDGEININIDLKNTVDVSLLQKQLEKLNKQLENAKKAFLAEVDTLEEYKINKQSIMKEIECVNKELNFSQDMNKIKSELRNKVSSAISMLDDDEIPVKKKNDTLKEFIESIIYNRSLDTLEINLYYTA